MDALFLKILDMSKIASIVIVFVLVARLFLCKVPQIYSYLLWTVVLFRLLCPISLEAPWSVLPDMKPIEDSYTLAEKDISFLDAGAAAYQAAGDALNGGLGIQHIPTTETDDNGNVIYVTSTWWEVWILFGKYLWLMGMAGMAGYSIFSYYKLKKKLVGIVLLQDNIYISDYIDSPFVMGLVSPQIYLPSSLTEKEQEYIILHEQQHIKRKDHWIKVLAFLALCIHWFNPLVWAAFILANKDMEMSCDEAVVNKLGGGIRADYSASLLSLATGRRLILGAPLAFGEGDTKGRIKNMAKRKKSTLWISIAALVVVIVVCIVLMLNPSSPKQEKAYSGLVVAHGGNPLVLQLQGDDGKNYGFVVKNRTELLWQDDESFYDENLSEDEKWNLLFTGMHVEIIANKRTGSVEESMNENVDEWFVAEKITITEIPRISSESIAMD